MNYALLNEISAQARAWAEEAYAKQNEQFTSHWDTPVGFSVNQLFEQKFAELILNECIALNNKTCEELKADESLQTTGFKTGMNLYNVSLRNNMSNHFHIDFL